MASATASGGCVSPVIWRLGGEREKREAERGEEREERSREVSRDMRSMDQITAEMRREQSNTEQR